MLAGLTALTVECSREAPVLQLLESKDLDFPSASAVEFYRDKLYVFGDDATHLLVLSPSYRVLDSVRYWPGNEGRIPKKEKPDVEAAVVLNENNKPLLAGIGSLSNEDRWRVWLYPLDSSALRTAFFFAPGTSFPGVKDLNVEGCCRVGGTLVFGNRAHLKNPVNQLIFWTGQPQLTTKELRLPVTASVAGLSGLYYFEEKDLLLLTASEEATESTTTDGAIGNSYLGWINGFSKKRQATLLTPDGFLKLSNIKAFAGQKVESVCVEKSNGNSLVLHLAADNDNGRSRLFRARLSLPR